MLRFDKSNPYHLSPDMVNVMLTPHIHVGDQTSLDWRLGWGLQHMENNHIIFWHWGARRLATRNFCAGDRSHQTGVVILTNHHNGLTLCEEIAHIALERLEAFPTFRWLLPADSWRADGLCPR
jgi:hypothetical protein